MQTVIEEHIPQIIGIIGTVMGTVLGSILTYFVNNRGKLIVSIERFNDLRSHSQQYAYNLKVFAYNASPNARYIKNINVDFYNNQTRKFLRIPTKCLIHRDMPKSSNGSKSYNEPRFGYYDGDYPIDTISLQGYTSMDIIMRGLISKELYKKLKNASSVLLSYEYNCHLKKRKRKVVRLKIRDKFSLCSVKKCTNSHEFPSG